MDIQTLLLRERFILSDAKAAHSPSLHVVSNRIHLILQGRDEPEEFVIRAQTMHMCVRMASRIVLHFQRLGSLTNRTGKNPWDEDWQAVYSDYERFYNPDIWCVVYHAGKPLFSFKEHHIFLDLIEQHDYNYDGSYDDVVHLAEQSLAKSGQNLTIAHNNNVALTLELSPHHGRCGVLHRGPNQTSTFSFTADSMEEEKQLNYGQIISATAAFLEAIQLCYVNGIDQVKLEYGIIQRFSREEKQAEEALKRLQRLTYEIDNMEKSHIIHYRPEKPNFDELILLADELARQTIEPPPEGDVLQKEESEALAKAVKKAQKSLENDTAQTIDDILHDEDGNMFQ